jgi:hypothetical protein
MLSKTGVMRGFAESEMSRSPRSRNEHDAAAFTFRFLQEERRCLGKGARFMHWRPVCRALQLYLVSPRCLIPSLPTQPIGRCRLARFQLYELMTKLKNRR